MQLIQWFDILIIGFVLILGIKGIINGLIKEIFGLIGLIGGLVVSSRFSHIAGEFIKDKIYNIQNQSMLDFVAFISLWICFWIVCLLIGKFLAKLVGASGLGFLDRIGGFIAGSGKIFLVLSAILAVISNTNLNTKIEPYFKDSNVYPILLSAGKWIANMDVKTIKDDIQNVVAKPQKEINQKLDNLISIDTNSIATNPDKNSSKKSFFIEQTDINITKGE